MQGKNVILIVACVIILLLLFRYRGKHLGYENAMAVITGLEQEKESMLKTIDEKGREITSVEAIVVQQNGIIEKQLQEIAELEELNYKVVFRTRTVYDTLRFAMRDTIIVNAEDTIFGQKFRYKDPWLLLDGYTFGQSIAFDTLNVYNAFTIEQDREKIGLWKYQTRVYVRNENPHTATDYLQTIVIQDEKKWYEKGIVKVGLGFAGGYLIGKR